VGGTRKNNAILKKIQKQEINQNEKNKMKK
jgi:hypothetical protein